MPVKIRLARRGRRKFPFYHIIVADSRAPRDGRFIEQLGIYNPMTKPATIELDNAKTLEWLMKGAQPTDTARAILKYKGVLYKRHLDNGVKKGALTQEDADKIFEDWITAKEEKIQKRIEETKEEEKEFYKRLSGSTKQKPAASAPATDEELSDFRADSEKKTPVSDSEEEE